MSPQPVRPAAVAGTWYPGTPAALIAEVDRYCASVTARVEGEVTALVVPHAGLVYSGPVAAHAYAQLRGRSYEAVVIIGPSHRVGFDGAAVCRRGAFETPLGQAVIAGDIADAILAATPVAHERPAAHQREHSLEMQLPFVQRVLPGVPIVPIVMGYQTRATVGELAHALARVLAHRRALLVASSDLSHFHEATRAAVLDAVVVRAVDAFDADGLERALETFPDHACGGGPITAVMRTAGALGARDARVLCYRDSGDVSGDKSAVVGYLAAVLGTFTAVH